MPTAQPDPRLDSRITSLFPRLNRIARYLAHPGLEYTADDLYQEMALTILDRSAGDSTFLDQRDGYLLQCASWDARNVAAKGRTYNRLVAAEWFLAVRSAAADDGDEISLLELFADPDLTPEEHYLQTEQLEELAAAAASLSPSNQKIVGLIAIGYNWAEIADQLGVSRSAVSQRKNIIARQLSTVVWNSAPTGDPRQNLPSAPGAA